jgi:hypothetical protein
MHFDKALKQEFRKFGLKSITQEHVKRVNPLAFRVKKELGGRFSMISFAPVKRGELKNSNTYSIFLHNEKERKCDLITELKDPILTVRRYPGKKSSVIEIQRANKSAKYNAEDVKRIREVIVGQLTQRGLRFSEERVGDGYIKLVTGKMRNSYANFPYHR